VAPQPPGVGGPELRRSGQYDLEGHPGAASDATALTATGVLAPAIGASSQQTVGQTAQRGADVGGYRVGDAAAVLMEVGIAGVMHTRLDAPVPATEREQVGRRGVVGVAAAHQMDKAVLLVAVGEIKPVAMHGDELRGEREAEDLGGDPTALHLTGFDPATPFLDRARLRGKRPPVAAGGSHGPAARAGCP
jgi:hypothetical protein